MFGAFLNEPDFAHLKAEVDRCEQLAGISALTGKELTADASDKKGLFPAL
jgi:hypothetical protein